jgi:hypothetical protein
MLSVPPDVMKPDTSSSPCSRSAVIRTTSLWMRARLGNAPVFSAFSWRKSFATSSTTACTSGPPS